MHRKMLKSQMRSCKNMLHEITQNADHATFSLTGRVENELDQRDMSLLTRAFGTEKQ